ncbi:MAG TPA: OmpH family outer membrane protein [Pyrinomonadaceae bacterium]|nr:OmpH family outer membrane protein [Pyrinomonadaceae bacterium]
MRIDRLIAAFAFIAALSISPVLAQRPAAGTPPTTTPQTTANVPDSKIAVIYSDLFLDDKTGIARFTTLLNTLNREFQPRQTELQQIQQRATALNDEIEKTKSVADPKTISAKIEQLEGYKVELKRKGEDAQQAYDKRRKEIFTPLQDSIGKALEAFAKQRGITVLIDGSQVPVVYAADSIDITRAFINDFNGKNPATASVTPPK